MAARLLPALLLAMLLAGLCIAGPALAQDTAPADTSARADTLQAQPPQADSLAAAQSLPQPSGAVPENAVQFSARDSLVLVFDGEDGDVGTLFGESKVTYGEATLNAHRVEMLMELDELHADGLPTDTGTVGLPQFQRGQGEAFTGEALAFNLRTERGRVVAARTTMDEGFIQGEVVKSYGDSVQFVRNGTYTTCDCPPGQTPSYSLRSNKMKVQGEWVYTGPLQLFIFNIPTPLWLPFGFLPAIEGRRSGPLPPNYGEDRQLGFFLKDWGWYWAINDYMDAQVRFGLWTQGSWQVSPLFRYNRRYRYQGRLQFDYVSEERGEPIDPDFQELTRASLRWQHQQTISPTSSFGGNVNFSTQSYLRTISDSFNDNVRQEINSNVRYSKNWPRGGRSVDVALRHSQVFATGAVNMTLPSLSFSQNSFKPFERETRGPGQDERWYERITTRYNGRLSNRYSFQPLTDRELIQRGDTTDTGEPIDPDVAWYEALFSPSAFRRATGDDVPLNFEAEHRIPVSAPFTVNRLPLLGTPLQLNLSPGFSYEEDWFIRSERRTLRTFIDTTVTGDGTVEVDTTERVVSESVPGFFALRQFSTSLSASTRFYGIFPFRIGPFNGFRHVARPSLSFSYQPDFGSDAWGYTRVLTNEAGEPVLDSRGNVQRFPIVSGVRTGEQRALSFSMGNEFQTRRVRIDSTGQEQSRTIDLLRVDVSTGYNFAADSLKLADLRLSARTDLFDRQLRLQFNAQLSPYAFENGRRVNRFVIEESFGFFRLTTLGFTARTSFQSKRRRGEPALAPRFQMGNSPRDAYTAPGQLAPRSIRERGAFNTWEQNAALGYVDFAIPWSIKLDFTYRYSNAGLRETQSAIVDADFDFSLTPNWKIAGSTGFDFTTGELSTTRLNILRDLGCWRMSFNWTPFGTFQSYGFSLNVKSGKLANLLRLDLPRSGIKDRFRGALR